MKTAGMSILALSIFFVSLSAQAQPARTWRTGQTSSYQAGDDGDLERGVSWPSPRFTDNGNGTVADNLTGLIWLKNANCDGTMTWQQALTYCNNLSNGACGLTDGSALGDWRLPNKKELLSLVDYSRYNPALPSGHPFSNVQSSYYWSATTNAYSTSLAWIVNMNDGFVNYNNKTSSLYVWPVRGGQGGPFGDLTILHPNGGETLNKGNDYTITWTSTNVTGNIQIHLYKGGTGPEDVVLQLAAGTENDGEYPFNPPDSLADGDDYLLGISAEGGAVWDFSDAFFTIEVDQTDTDGDGIPYYWEEANGLNPNDPTDAEMDFDNDGLTNLEEYNHSTDPRDWDSDGDGMPDGWEVQYGLDPNTDDASLHSDADSLTNGEEYYYRTDPTNEDTDGDGISDSDEVANGTDSRAMTSSLTAGISDLMMSVGSSKTIALQIENASRDSDTFDLSVTGIDASWYALAQTRVILSAGEIRDVQLEITVPENCSLTVLEYNIHVSAESPNTGLVANGGVDIELAVTMAPIMSGLMPQDGEKLAANTAEITWQTDGEATTELYYRISGTTEYTNVSGDSGATHRIMLEDLLWDATYEWYAVSTGPCQGVQSAVRTFHVQDGVVFVERESTHEILRDYDQQISLTIQNRDVVSHTVLVEVVNPNEDLVAGFVGSGSEDEEITLDAGETRVMTLALHAQDAQSDQYVLTLKLTADAETGNPIVDYTSATVNVRDPVFDLNFMEISNNPAIFTNTFRITNNGDTITDLRVFAEEAIAPQIVFQPKIDHLRLGTGASALFSATFQPLDGAAQYTGLLTAQGAGQSVSLETHFGCPGGTFLYDVFLNDVHICLRANDWYCNNRPKIEVDFAIPRGITPENITRARLYMHYSLPWARNTYRKHDVTVKLNGIVIQNLVDTIPEGPYGIEIPPALIRTGTNSVGRNTVTLVTTHMNRGHYVVTSDFELILDIDSIDMGSVCSTSQAEADLSAEGFPYLCGGEPAWELCPILSGVTPLDDSGTSKRNFNPGDTVQFRVQVSNPDLDDQDCTLTFIVDDDFGDAEIPFEQTASSAMVSGGSDSVVFEWQIPQDTDATFYHLKATLSGLGDCEDEVTYRNAFSVYQPVEDYEVQPTSYDFGDVEIGDQREKSFTVTNTGGLDVVLGDITIAGDSELTIEADSCSQSTLGQSESCTFKVVFFSDAEETASAVVSIPSSDPGDPSLSVPVSGTGVDLSYESPRLIKSKWKQYELEHDSNNDGSYESYLVGCTPVAIGQLANYYLKEKHIVWLEWLLRDMVVYPRFRPIADQDPIINLFSHPGCETLDSYDDEIPENQVFRVSTGDASCSTEPDDPVVTFLWNVALGCDADFVNGAGTGVGSYGTEHEPYHWVGNDSEQKTKSLLIDRFWFKRDMTVSEKLTRLNDERTYITNSIDRGYPVLIAMYRTDTEDETHGHDAIIDQYRIESNGDFKVRINMGWGKDAFDPGEPSQKWYDGGGSIDVNTIQDYTWFYIFKNTVPNEDADGDGMPNDWEQIHGLNPIDPGDATGDLDSDGLTNLEEYQNGTFPRNPDTDGDGISDGDEANHGTDPNTVEYVDITLKSDKVVVSLTGDNRVFVEVLNQFCVSKDIDFELAGLDSDWYTIDAADQSFTLNPFGRKVVSIQLDLPEDCGITAQDYPFHVEALWESGGQTQTGGDDGTLVITSNPNVYPLAIPKDTKLAGNTIFVAWKTDVTATPYIFYKKLGDEDFIEASVESTGLEHRVTLADLDYFTYYEFYTESHSSCGGMTTSDVYLVRTGKAVKFVNGINEFWIDRDYDQPVTLTITNTDIIEHDFQLSVINDNEDIVVGFVGDGTPTREATLFAGESTDVELVIHAPDALKTVYDIYLKMVSDEGEYDSFVDYSHAIVHVRPFVANLDIQPVQSTPGLMTTRFRLMNYGDTLSDIAVYVDAANRTKTTINPSINHYRMENGDFVEFDIQAQEYMTGTLYARSGGYVVSAPFEIGCPPDTELNTYTVNDVAIVAQIKDWYCTNKMNLELPFAVPNWFGHDDLSEAALEVNFSLPMAFEKYDPHTVVISINGETVATLEDTIPQGLYTYRFPTSLINLGVDGPAENRLQLQVDGITKGQYIVATDFKIILNVDQIQVDLCITPPGGTFQPKQALPDPETKITDIKPAEKYRPGDTVVVEVTLKNNDSSQNPAHFGIVTVTLENNSNPDGNWIQPDPLTGIVSIEGGKTDTVPFTYTIPDNADDIDYRLSATFENVTLNMTESVLNQSGFWVRTPLIIVHGIKGSVLEDDDLSDNDNPVWSPRTLIRSICDNELENAYCKAEDGSSVKQNIRATQTIKEIFEWEILNMIFSGDIFRGLEEDLKNRAFPGAPYYRYHRMGGTDLDFDPENMVIDDREKEDVFYFVYDWRLDNAGTANGLGAFIGEVTTKLDYPKVNILAHSMGGLVCKSLFKDDPLIQQHVDKMVFLGTPNLGAVEPFSMIAHGLEAPMFGNTISPDFIQRTQTLIDVLEAFDILDPDILSLILDIISNCDAIINGSDPENCSEIAELARAVVAGIETVKSLLTLHPYSALLSTLDELNRLYSFDRDINFIHDDQLKDFIQNVPSAYQLLPSDEYFNHYLEGYYELNGNRMESSASMDQEIQRVGNDGLLADAKNLHADIDGLDLTAMPFKSYMILGCGLPTPTLIQAEGPEDSEALAFTKRDGDGTVPMESAFHISSDKKYAARGAKHRNLPSQEGVKLLVRSILRGYEDDFQASSSHPVAEYYEGFCGLPTGTRIIITSASGLSGFEGSLGSSGSGSAGGSVTGWPRTYEPGAKHGPNSFDPEGFTGMTGNTIHTGILGSDYRFSNDGVEIFVPEGSAYTLEFKGVDSEYLDVKFQMMTEGGVIKTFVFAEFILDIDGCGEIHIDLTGVMTDPVLRLDYECDGQFDAENILPSYELNETQSGDDIPPVTTAEIAGAMGGSDWYLPDVTISLSATDNDDGSGVLATRYRFSWDGTFTDYSGPIQVTEARSYALIYYSIDRNLNKETEKVLEFKIDDGAPRIISVNPDSQTSDVDRSTDIQVVFSEMMDVTLLTGSNVSVSGSITSVHGGTISYDSDLNTMTFDPDADFLLSETVTVVVEADVGDLAGITLDGNGNGTTEGSPGDDYTWFFPVGDSDGLIVQITEVDVTRCPTIRATLIVTDENGDVVTDLTASEFFVFEDNIPVSPIRVAFVDQSASPISVSLALDYSGSMSSTAITDMENAAVEFINNMVAEDAGEIVKFANGVEIMQAFTTDKIALVDAVYAQTSLSSASTSLYDAIYEGITDASAESGRKAVIAMTDGRDNSSTHTDTEVTDHAESNGVPVFTIGLGSNIDATVLQDIADQTGGVYYEAPSSADLEAIYESISNVLKNQYILMYQTDSRDGQEHTLQIIADSGTLAGSDTTMYISCLDLDGDGLWDGWEQQIIDADQGDGISSIEDVMPWDDFDADGFSNMREFLSDSDPVDSEGVPACWGDFAFDGDVDGADLAIFSSEFGMDDCFTDTRCNCDLDGDWSVNQIDLRFFSEDMGRIDCQH